MLLLSFYISQFFFKVFLSYDSVGYFLNSHLNKNVFIFFYKVVYSFLNYLVNSTIV